MCSCVLVKEIIREWLSWTQSTYLTFCNIYFTFCYVLKILIPGSELVSCYAVEGCDSCRSPDAAGIMPEIKERELNVPKAMEMDGRRV